MAPGQISYSGVGVPKPPAPKKHELMLVWGTHQYLVKSITNSTKHKPGEWLNPSVVQELCDDPDWQVTIADDQIITNIVGTVLGHVPTMPLPPVP